jgi:hypothetical protein
LKARKGPTEAGMSLARPSGGEVDNIPTKTDDIVETQKEVHLIKHPKEGPKVNKGVSSEPHPLDRHSGTGRGKEIRKGGAGRRNYGTYMDDLRDNVNNIDPFETKETTDTSVSKDWSLPKGEVMTLSEYQKKNSRRLSEDLVNQKTSTNELAHHPTSSQ